MEIDGKKYLTAQEAAIRLAASGKTVSAKTLRDKCASGDIPGAIKQPAPTALGYYWLILEESLEAIKPNPRGKPRSENPTDAAIAKRKLREK